MCNSHQEPTNTQQHSRRRFLAVPVAAAALGLVGNAVSADTMTREQRDKMSPDDIINKMKNGNERFRTGAPSIRNYLAEQRGSAQGQYPVAMILSCIDSRAPAENIMDLGIANVFNARVAGNIANEDILGSMEFACKVAGAKVVLVMGHTACGAIAGAIDNVQLGNLTGLLGKIQPAVKATEFKGERSAKNPAFVNAVARKNVELTKALILEKSPVLNELHKNGGIKIVGAMYDLETANIDFFTS